MSPDAHEWRSLGGKLDGSEEYVLGDIGLTLPAREWGAEFWVASATGLRETRLAWKARTEADLSQGLEILGMPPREARSAADDLWPKTVRAQRAALYRQAPQVTPAIVKEFERNPGSSTTDRLESAIYDGRISAKCLGPLIVSGDDRLLGPMMYILGETDPEPVLDELVELMQTHPDKRGDALGAFYWGIQTTRGDVLAEVLQSRDASDRHEAKVANYLLRDLSVEQVAALEAFVGDGDLREQFDRWRTARDS